MNRKIKSHALAKFRESLAGDRAGNSGGNAAKYLVVGAGPAGAAAIEAIRKRDRNGSITVVSSEKDAFYSRPLISYLLSGDIGEEKMSYRGKDFISANSPLRIIAGESVSKVNARAGTAVISDGRILKWEKLIIASGGVPVIPPAISGAKNLRTFTTIEDARAIAADIKSGASRAAVIGGGFIGLKCAEALAKRGLRVTLIELSARLLPSLLDDDASAVFQKNVEKHGVSVRTLSSAEGISDGGKKIRLAGGEVVAADLVVSAVGVRPNVEFLKDSGIRLGRGVLVGRDMRSSADGVFAAGDCAEAPEFFSQERRPVPIWPVARHTGYAAGANAAGGSVAAERSLSMNSVEVFGLAVIAAGITNPEAGSRQTVETSGGGICPDGKPRYKKLVFDGDRLAGFIMLGDVSRAGIYTSLIRNRTPVGAFRRELAGDSFGFIAVGEENWKKRITPMEV